MLNARTQLGSLLIENSQIEEGGPVPHRRAQSCQYSFWLLQEANFSLADTSRREGAYEHTIQNYKQLAVEWGTKPAWGFVFYF